MSAKLPIIKEPHPQPLPACGESTRRLPVPSRRSGEPGGGGELKRSFGGVGFRVCLLSGHIAYLDFRQFAFHLAKR